MYIILFVIRLCPQKKRKKKKKKKEKKVANWMWKLATKENTFFFPQGPVFVFGVEFWSFF
jgi:hypothetical protein